MINVSNYGWHNYSAYTELHKESLKSINPRDSWDMDRVKNDDLKAAITKIHEETKCLNIDDVAEKLAVRNGWNPEVIDFLSSLEVNDFYTWMKGNPERLTKKVRSGLLIFKDLSTSNQAEAERYAKITTNVIDALKRISGENSLNQKRIKNIYGVE